MDFDSLKPDATQAAPAGAPTSFDALQSDEDKFSTPGQQLATAAEGVGQGIIGPLAPKLEISSGLTTPENIRARAEANPMLHGASQVGGFLGSALTGAGVAPLVEGLGKATAEILPAVLPKLAMTGIKTGTEMAALQASDELSKMVTQDPNQSISSAATNIGLSGIIGLGSGVALGAVSPLWHSTSEKLGLAKIIDDAKAQYDFRLNTPDTGSAAIDELSGRMSAMEDLRHNSSSIKGEAISKALPEVTPQNAAKIDSQIQDISDQIATKLDKAADSVKTKSAVPYLAEDFSKFQDAVTNPQSDFSTKFNALDTLKKDLSGYAKWGATEEGTARAALGRDISNIIRPALEDTKVWGDAGSIQKKINSAISTNIDAQKDMVSKFTSKMGGDKIVDPNKIQSYLNQAAKSKAGLKANVLNNYLDSTQKLADTIKSIHEGAGLEAPISASLNPTPVLNKSLEKTSAGSQLGNWLYEKGLSDSIGHSAAGAVGAGLGHLVGHPELGALAGERLFGKLFSSVAKPFLESATNSGYAKGTLNYISQVAKGQKIQSEALKSLFHAGAIAIPQQGIPDAASRAKLQDQLDNIAQNPQSALNIGQNIAHYMPDHASAAAQMTAIAQNYLNSIKPKQVSMGPLEDPPPVSKSAQAGYDRQLNIAQQPLMILQHIKTGNIIPQDIATIKTIYPNLYTQMVAGIGQEIITAKNDGKSISYQQKLSLSSFMGQPLDSTMNQSNMLASIMANAPKGPPQPPQGKKPAKPSMAQQEKLDDMYATNTQSREGQKEG